MFPKEKRLNNKEFDRFFGVGKRYHSTYFTLIYVPFPLFKVSAVVGKKISKKAVGRNQLRRRMYEVLNSLLPETGKDSGVFIFLAKRGSEGLDLLQLEDELKDLVGRISN